MSTTTSQHADLILTKARLATLDARGSFAEAAAIKDGRILAVGRSADIKQYRGHDTVCVDGGNRTVIPGLND